MPNTLSSFTLLLFSWVFVIQVTFAQISFPLTASSSDNCKGSHYCGNSDFLPSNSICLQAINQYNTDFNYTSYTSHYIEQYSTGCTAFYDCDNDSDYLTLNGYELQQLFQSIYTGSDTTTGVNVGCGICGSLYFNDDKCRVTVNYCAACHATYPDGG